MTDIRTRFDAYTPEQRRRFLRLVPKPWRAAWDARWPIWAHPGQLPPDEAAPSGRWRTWVMLAGRGFGKTRAGAEWVAECARAHPGARIALVAATIREAREVMVEGPSGVLSLPLHRTQRPRWESSRGRLVFPGGSEAQVYSGANPEGLRGPQHHFAWCDELAKWRHPDAAWDMLQLGLRCGDLPRALVTTTPRGGCGALLRILAAEGTELTGGASGDNPHLPAAFLEAVEGLYGGTRMGREEIDGVMLEDVAGSLWPAALVERSRGAVPEEGELRRVVVGVDPPASAEGVCGIVVCGLDADGVGHVLADWSLGGLSPEGWARRVSEAAEAHGADRVVAEKNQGGEMVRAVLRSAGLSLPLRLVSATRGKAARAEPVAGLFEAGRAKFAGRFAELETELGRLVPGERPALSPDRADAMVWALWALLVEKRALPSVTQL